MKSKRYLLSFAKAKGSIAAVALAAVLMAANVTVAPAQNIVTENNGIEETVIRGVDDLSGVDPSSAICTSNGTAETDGNKIVYLYNVGAQKFLSVGGLWGTHASLNVSPYSIYIYMKNKYLQTYSLESKVNGSGTGSYLGIKIMGYIWTEMTLQALSALYKPRTMIQKRTRYISSKSVLTITLRLIRTTRICSAIMKQN